MVCVGTNKGSLRVYLFPSGQFRDYRAHTSSINKICVTCFDDFLITCSEDGAIVYWQIGNKLRDSEMVPTLTQVTHVALADQDEFEKQMQQGKKWEKKLREFETEADFVSRMKELKFDIKKREMTSRFNVQLDDVVKQIKREMENERVKGNLFDLAYEQLSCEHFQRIDKVIETYGEKIKYEQLKIDHLNSQIKLVETRIGSNYLKLSELENKNDPEKTQNSFSRKSTLLQNENILNLFDDEDADFVENIIDLTFDYEKRLTDLIKEILSTKDEIIKLKNDLKTLKSVDQYAKNKFVYDDAEKNRFNNELLQIENVKNKSKETVLDNETGSNFIQRLENIVLNDIKKEMRENRSMFWNLKQKLFRLLQSHSN